MLSRTAVAKHAAHTILKGDKNANQELINQIAGWLKDVKKTRQSKYLFNDIAMQLSKNGYVLVRITTARQIDDSAKQSIKNFLNSVYINTSNFEIVYEIDENLIGGVLIDTPKGVLDLSVKHKLMNILKGTEL